MTYLLSSVVSGIEHYYTADSTGAITDIGTRQDWSQGFNDDVLAAIDSSTYSTLEDAKVWINSTSSTLTASEDTSSEGLLWTSDSTAINTSGYSGITNASVVCTDNCRFAVSFDGRDMYKTIGNGYIADTSITNDYKSAKLLSDTTYNVDNMFDGNDNTNISISSKTTQTIESELNSDIVVRKYDIKIDSSSRLPCHFKLFVYDSTNSAWVTLDEITINTNLDITRNIKNEISSSIYRWEFSFNADSTDEFGNLDSDTNLVVNTANLYGRVPGVTWIDCSKSEVKTIGLTKSEFLAITTAQWDEIFDQTQLDFIVYIPSGESFTSISLTFPPNLPPEIQNFTATAKTVHNNDVTLTFDIVDPEGMDCSYEIYLNGKKIDSVSGVASGSTQSLTITNNLFTVLDDPTTAVKETNEIIIRAYDDKNATDEYTYHVTKLDSIPTYVGVMRDNVYNISIDDADKDQVKYTAKLNGKVVASIPFTNVISLTHIVMDTDDIIHGGVNTLEIFIEDSAGGTVTVTETFIGDYYGLMYLDESGTLLSTDKGSILSKLAFPATSCGTSSIPVEFYVWNHSSRNYTGIVLYSPKDINGKTVNVYDATDPTKIISTSHQDGDVWIQLSLTDSFDNSATFYALSLPSLASNQKIKVYARVESTNYESDVMSYDFDVNGTASYEETVTSST